MFVRTWWSCRQLPASFEIDCDDSPAGQLPPSSSSMMSRIGINGVISSWLISRKNVSTAWRYFVASVWMSWDDETSSRTPLRTVAPGRPSGPGSVVSVQRIRRNAPVLATQVSTRVRGEDTASAVARSARRRSRSSQIRQGRSTTDRPSTSDAG